MTASPSPSSGGATSGANGSGDDNTAVAVNTHDGKVVYAIRLKITQTNDDVVDPVNAAVAVASCSDCTTVAIALEGVLVYGDPTVFAPENLALAINTDCSNCQTLATAYQNVIQNDTRVRITGKGRREIAAIRQDLQQLRHSGLDIFAVQQRVDEAAGRFLEVLRTEVVPVGKPSSTAPLTPSASPSSGDSGGSATPSPTSSNTPSPSG